MDVCKEPNWMRNCIGRGPENWSFNSKTGKCEKFKYTGCEGTANNFPTRNKCVRACETGTKFGKFIKSTIKRFDPLNLLPF